MVTILFRVGNLIEDSAIARSKRDIEALTKIRPNTANLVRPDGSVVAVAAKSVKIGSTIVVKPGERCLSTVSSWRAVPLWTPRPSPAKA